MSAAGPLPRRSAAQSAGRRVVQLAPHGRQKAPGTAVHGTKALNDAS
jgi:hypothetical protein